MWKNYFPIINRVSSSDDEENPYPGIALGCCRFLVATIDEIKKLKGQESFSGKVTHVVNYDVPHDQTEYTFRVSLMSNSEKVTLRNG